MSQNCETTFVAGRKATVATKEDIRSLQQTDPEQLFQAQIDEAEGNFRRPLEDVFPYHIQPRDKIDYGKGSSSVPLHKLDYLPGYLPAIVKLSIEAEGQRGLAGCLTHAAILQRLDSYGSKVDKTVLGEFMQACDPEKAAKVCREYYEINNQLLTESSTAFERFSLSGETGYPLGKFLKQVVEIEEEMEWIEPPPAIYGSPPRRSQRTFDQEPEEAERTAPKNAQPNRIIKKYRKKPTSVFATKPASEKRAHAEKARQILDERNKGQARK